MRETAVSVDYYRGNDRTSTGSKSSSVVIGAVQKIEDATVETYLGYRIYELADTTANYLDASSVLFGARWKF